MDTPTIPDERYDVVVVGAGNAAMCAALAAREEGASVLVLERAPLAERGGNTAFTAGAMRVAYRGVEDLLEIMPDLSPSEIAGSDFGSYLQEDFFADMARVTAYRANPELVQIIVSRSHETLTWMRTKGIRFMPMFARQAFKVGDRFRFWGGLTVEAAGGGPGLVESEHRIAAEQGVEILYQAPATALLADDDGVHGVEAKVGGRRVEIEAGAVVLASGGFQANVEWRTRYLGPRWDLAVVRGTRFNTGEGHRMAMEIGASPIGNWSGCHAVGWDKNAPKVGDLAVGDGFQKHSYPFGIMVNEAGRRFVDEGADFRNYTYAKYGRSILEQPNLCAWQVFDSKVSHLLRVVYRIREVTKVTADTVEDLARRMEGVDADGLLAEVAAYNAAVRTEVPFDPTVKDGRGTTGLSVPKSNWANTIDTPPFVAYGVTCGITFTFGGIQITPETAVVSTDGDTIPGLFAAGEIVGDIFYENYPGGSGLTAGSVFGRAAGHAAARARKDPSPSGSRR
jgi:tricarballylate dehydrogenase